MRHMTAPQRWQELDADRQTFMSRCERYAQFTQPNICLPTGSNQNNTELVHDYQSLGAQGVNHVANKLMLALFAPSRPFFRLDPGEKMAAWMAEAEMSEEEMAAELAVAERNAVRILDQKAIRPKVYQGLKHLIVTGNFLLCLDKKPRAMGLRKYCVKRAPNGDVLEIVIREVVPLMSLDREARDIARMHGCIKETDETVEHYRWIRKVDDGRFRCSQWVNDTELPDKYKSVWTEDNLPYRPIAWDLGDGDDYGSGLVENYAADFAALSMMSEATVHAAILASEFRWVINPASQTRPEDFMASRNGSAIPGVSSDFFLLSTNKGADLQVNLAIAEQYIGRIGKGFMLQSAVTRNAERVTAEEIRMTAEELETSYGGAYSRIAVDAQTPMARYLMKEAKQDIAGKDLQPSIITGMDALSRTGDRDNLVLLLGDLAGLGQLPDDVRGRMKMESVISAFAAARGLSPAQYMITEDEFQANQQAQLEQQRQLMAEQASLQAQARGNA